MNNWRASEASETLLSVVSGKLQYVHNIVLITRVRVWCGEIFHEQATASEISTISHSDERNKWFILY